MTKMYKLDLIDRKILLELDTNARESFSIIGKKMGIGKNNVQYRVNKLIKDGVIKKFVVQPSLAKLGLILGKIYFQLSGLSEKEEEDLNKYLMSNEKVSWVAKCEGRWDLMIGSYVKNLTEFVEVKKDFFIKYGSFVADYSIIFLTEGHTSQRTYLLNKKMSIPKKIKKFMGKKSIQLSDRNLNILKYISNNARFNYTEIANNFGINIKTAQKVIEELENNEIIQGYVTFLNLEKIGYNFFKLCIYLNNYETKKEAFINYCLELPNVVHVIESLGPWEIELEIETETPEEFYNLTHKIRNNFSDIIKKTETVMISNERKLDFLPTKI